jgi:RND family efflux transporter MFP subunit
MRDLKGASRLAVAVLVALSVAACTAKKKEEPAPKPSATVVAAPAVMTALPRTVEASGTIAAWQEVPVGSEAGGLEAVGVYVDEGAYVRQGQTIVKLDDRLLRAQVASAQATLNRDAAALERARELNAKGFLAKAALDTAVANHATAAAALAEARVRLDQTNIRAPVAGQITSRSVVKGQIVAAGSELFRLVRESAIELNAQVPEADLALVRPGMNAAVTGEQGLQTGGTVRIVTPQVDPQTRLGLARISLPNGSGFRPGNFARASINVGIAPSIAVPSTAIIFRDGRPGVFTVDATHHVHFKLVTLGDRSATLVGVQGLPAGVKVVAKGGGFLSEGNFVSVAGEPDPAPRREAAPAKGARR